MHLRAQVLLVVVGPRPDGPAPPGARIIPDESLKALMPFGNDLRCDMDCLVLSISVAQPGRPVSQ